MSVDQREQIKSLSNSFMKVMLGISGAALTLAFYMQREENNEFKAEVRKSFDEIIIDARQTKNSTNQIQSDVRLIDYRLKQLERK